MILNYKFEMLLKKVFVISIVLLLTAEVITAESHVLYDKVKGIVEIQSCSKNIKLRINTNEGCFIDRFYIKNNQIVDRENGISSAVNINNYWHLTKYESKNTSVKVDENSVVIENISYGPSNFQINERWTFETTDEEVYWHIHRVIPSNITVNAAANSHWEFADMETWTGAILDNGAVAWCKLLPEDFYTFGNHASGALFWNSSNGICFEVNPVIPDDKHMASRFTRSPKGTLVFAQTLSDKALETRVNLSRCLRQDSIWKPFTMSKGVESMTYRLSVSELENRFELGEFIDVDENAVREILNTIIRYGVIDSKLCGANGWRSGYICLHEQWYGQLAMAVQDENYTHNLSETYDNFRDHAVLENGRVLARFKDNSVDAMKGTYTDHGFYEAQWGYLLDSQPDYVIVVSEQFHNTGDLDWVRGQKQTCESALEYMLKRDSDGDGLLEMINSSHADARGSDWIDIVWAAHENALVNAEMYQAMILWAEIEEILGDHIKAKYYKNAAKKLKDSFNKSIDNGGFWNPKNKWYVYWRDKDDSIHGDNLVIPVNFAAIGYGLCDDDTKKAAILSTLESVMQKENLFAWPLCVSSYKPEEASAGNFPFPCYENGDIFLSWAELGTRCYADYNPDIAMRYINNIINQYKKDGLAHQRYSRVSQKGLGDDILAGNGMAIVGLYRNIFGIQPQYNRLYLEPHIPKQIEGTSVQYKLRDTKYKIDLHVNQNTVSANRFSISSASSFGVNIETDKLQYFSGKNSKPTLSFNTPQHDYVKININQPKENKPLTWSIKSNKQISHKQTVYNLKAGKKYTLYIDSKNITNMTADKNGSITFRINLQANKPKNIYILPYR